MKLCARKVEELIGQSAGRGDDIKVPIGRDEPQRSAHRVAQTSPDEIAIKTEVAITDISLSHEKPIQDIEEIDRLTASRAYVDRAKSAYTEISGEPTRVPSVD